ncbi:MAG: hypothetical protein DELT_01722 [Desulfovibrio sp.]
MNEEQIVAVETPAENGETLLTRETGESGAVEDIAPQQDCTESDPLSLIPATPEEYALTFGDNVTIDEQLLANFKATAHELGIPQGKAQALADFYTHQVAGATHMAQAAQAVALEKARSEWEATITSRPGFKQEVLDAKRTLKEFGSPELKELLDQSYLGSAPAMFDFVVKVGKALGEPEARGRGMRLERHIPLMDRLWPDKKMA